MTLTRKKLIEVALPLEAINAESLRRKQKAPKGFPTSFHKWWAQRPLSACRAVIFASLIDDPSARPDKFPTEQEQVVERERLLGFIRELIGWDNSHNDNLLSSAWKEILDSTNGNPPTLFDPFCGGASIPLEAQRLGLETYASDLNPVAVIINKAMIEIPPKFAGKPPVHPDTSNVKTLLKEEWFDAHGLANDVIYYAQWMRDEAEKRIGHIYPKAEITTDIAKDRPDLNKYIGRKLTVIAWLWARTVTSPNPAFSEVEVPLATTYMLSSKDGKEVYVEPVVENGNYHFIVKMGRPKNAEKIKNGSSAGKRAAFQCLLSGVPITYDYIRQEGQAGRIGTRLMAIVAEGDQGRVYLTPTEEHETIACNLQPNWKPEIRLEGKSRVNVSNYGYDKYGDLFTPRQLVALTTFSDLIHETHELVKRDALTAGFSENDQDLAHGGNGARAYADAISVYLACLLDRMVYYGSSFTTWLPKDNALRDCMPRQAIAMTWDFAEANPFGKSSADILTCAYSISNYLDVASPNRTAFVSQCDAREIPRPSTAMNLLFSTDPPYYDNISYADLSDFFYVWLRSSLKPIFPELFTTLAVPKADELVATPYRHGSKEKAEAFFLDGMTEAMKRLTECASPDFPVTIYYAFKQVENDDDGIVSTGWDTFLEAMIRAGLAITGTWPLRTEGAGRMIAKGTNALASSIVLVCRKRASDAPTITRREFVALLQAELPAALTRLQAGYIAPVDLAQAAIGPGMAVYTRFAQVIDAQGQALTVRQALVLINQTLDEALAEQEGDFDADTRWALAWFEQSGFAEGEFGVADVLSRAKDTSVQGMVDAGILASGRGKVRLLKPAELDPAWDPAADKRLTAWEMVHQLVRALESGGEASAAELMAQLGAKAETARELCYRLYTICERKKRAAEALSYNALVQSWPEAARLAREQIQTRPTQASLF